MPYDMIAATVGPMATLLPVLLSAVVAFLLTLATIPDRDDTARWESIAADDARESCTRRRLYDIARERMTSAPTRTMPTTIQGRARVAYVTTRYDRRRAYRLLRA